jgi:hypothetical protein
MYKPQSIEAQLVASLSAFLIVDPDEDFKPFEQTTSSSTKPKIRKLTSQYKRSINMIVAMLFIIIEYSAGEYSAQTRNREIENSGHIDQMINLLVG